MIEIKKDKIFADGIERHIDNVNLINFSRNYLSFSGRIGDCVKYDKTIEVFYQELTQKGLTGFVLLNNDIVNLNNIVSVDIEFYQYAGISIHKTSKENAELYHLNFVCKNGKKETIPFRTYKEAEECFKAVNKALKNIKNEEEKIL
ncbi:MAG: hypothetical protein IKY10_00130 [Clostridia bacterium]|nr:hypothetical protein [Clostridia bacterium]